MNEIQARLDESNRTLNDYDAAKKKLVVENTDLLRQLEEAESQIGQLTKLKLSLTNQLDDTRKLADDESRVSKIYEFSNVIILVYNKSIGAAPLPYIHYFHYQLFLT